MDNREKARFQALRYALASLSHQDFRSRLHPEVRAGNAKVIAAHVDDLAHDVLARVEAAGGAANVVAHTPYGYAIVWVRKQAAGETTAEGVETQRVAETSTFGMLCDAMRSVGEGKKVVLHPVVLHGDREETLVATGELISV
jgi:hypothetical protein